MDRNMTLNEFVEAVKEHIFDGRPEMAENHTVDVSKVTKNNGRVMNGLTIREADTNISPTIYLERYYDDFLNGASLSDITDELLEVYEENIVPQNISIDFFTDFEKAKDRIAMKVINAEKNADSLMSMPHYKFGDLAAIFQVQVDSSEFGNAVVSVRDEHMSMWGVSTETLFEYAKANMEERHPIRIQSMLEVLRDLMGGDVPEGIAPTEGPQMYVMTNENKFNGAAAMIFTDKLETFAEEHGSNIYIIPSSIHECILLPDTGDMDVDQLETMVREVNGTQVPPEEVLSDNVYFYDKDVKTIYIAKSNEPCVLECDGKDFSKERKPIASDEKSRESMSIKDMISEGKDKSMSMPDVTRTVREKEQTLA